MRDDKVLLRGHMAGGGLGGGTVLALSPLDGSMLSGALFFQKGSIFD